MTCYIPVHNKYGFENFPSSHQHHMYKVIYLSTVSGRRIELYCPLLLAEPPRHYRCFRTGPGPRHSCSPRVRQCRCSCSCCSTARWCGCGCCRSCASRAAESSWPSCRAWHLTDSRHLGEEGRGDGWAGNVWHNTRRNWLKRSIKLYIRK